jgi:3'(2'), 5'-bisphosphate nucleotidase
MEKSDLNELKKVVLDAGEAILKIYGTDFSVEVKEDDSPLTQADLAAHEIIHEGLSRLFPDVPILSEESSIPNFETRSAWCHYWLVDPLDGTKEFVNRNGEFTVNVALIKNHEPMVGLVGVPVSGKLYVGDTDSGLAVVESKGSSKPLAGRLVGDRSDLGVVASRSHGGDKLERFLEILNTEFPDMTKQSVGSSLKLCILALGEADFYPRIGPTNEWDIAAAHAVLRASGGELYEMSGLTKQYNTKESLLNEDFYAVSDKSYGWHELIGKLMK